MAKAKETIIRKGVEAALKLAAENPWGELTLAEIAEAAELDLSEFHGVADKADIAAAIEPMLDKAMSAEMVDLDETARERLFDVLMLRFEEMEKYRGAILSLQHYRERNPRRLAKLGKARLQTARWALACAGLDGHGDVPMSVRAAGLAWIIARTERAWRKEESADFSRTMAELDKQLRASQERLSWLSRMTRRGRASAHEEAV